MCQLLTIQGVGKLTPGSQPEIEKKVLEDEEVLFAWEIASVELDDKTGTILLKMIVQQWLTIRGFSFAGAFIEQYKNTTKKGLQQSKALHKKYLSRMNSYCFVMYQDYIHSNNIMSKKE